MFMWEWQHVFQGSVETLLEQVLNILEIQVQINVFIMGIPCNNKDVNFIYFQPESCEFHSEHFKNIFEIVKDIFDNDPEHEIFLTAPHLNQEHKDSLYPKALREAVTLIINEDQSSDEWTSFCSFPVKLNQHWIITVIQVDKKDFDSQYRLKQNSYQFHYLRQCRIDCSFLDAIIWMTLSKCEEELQSKSRGNVDWVSQTEAERVLEDAASSFLKSIVIHVKNIRSDLMELSNIISSERYEGAGSKGRLVICKKDNPHILVKVLLKKPIYTNNYRGIRKLLEVSSSTMALLCDGQAIWGLGTPLNTYNSDSEDLFEVRFTEHYTWELVHAENVMLRVKYRQPHLPKQRFNKTQFCDSLYVLFGIDKDETALIILNEAVDAAVQQRHGTMIIITLEAKKESERLKYQSTCIDPITASKEIIAHISGIDGAILMTPDGLIHSFGVILDGLASQNGNPARGARFNSAIRYVDSQKNNDVKCLAIIVSEDGYVNFYPSLKSRIHRSFIDQLLDDLDKCADSSEFFDEDQAMRTLTNLEKSSFYLLNNDIERANRAKKTIIDLIHRKRSEEMAKTGIGYIIFDINDFVFDDQMNSKYYI